MHATGVLKEIRKKYGRPIKLDIDTTVRARVCLNRRCNAAFPSWDMFELLLFVSGVV